VRAMAERYDLLPRPTVLRSSLSTFDADIRAAAGAPVSFDALVGRNVLGATADKVAFITAALRHGRDRLHRACRNSPFNGSKALGPGSRNAGHKKSAQQLSRAEDALFADPADPLVNWTPAGLEQACTTAIPARFAFGPLRPRRFGVFPLTSSTAGSGIPARTKGNRWARGSPTFSATIRRRRSASSFMWNLQQGYSLDLGHGICQNNRYAPVEVPEVLSGLHITYISGSALADRGDRLEPAGIIMPLKNERQPFRHFFIKKSMQLKIIFEILFVVLLTAVITTVSLTVVYNSKSHKRQFLLYEQRHPAGSRTQKYPRIHPAERGGGPEFSVL